jgi:hypothetical protein
LPGVVAASIRILRVVAQFQGFSFLFGLGQYKRHTDGLFPH